MATYVLIHGAGDTSWYWHLVARALRGRGHDVVAVDLPCEDESAGWSEYTDAVLEAIGTRSDLVVVAQSAGGFTAPLVCAARPAGLLVLVAGMIPAPGETPNQYWTATRYHEVKRDRHDGDTTAIFYHDVPPALAAEALKRSRRQAEAIGNAAWPLPRWPDVPVRFLLCRDDRLFPADWLRGVVRDRLGIEPDEIDGGHCPALARPDELVARFEAYRELLSRGGGGPHDPAT
ncbi:MAG TPA: alpha/beta hydrolase [Kofleriaceae bacterium]|jgi:pimeloyl-ACP methyl ester carboxylesterase|nr:alpha/beta hydrolase [Kofleriaceae bacterium]